MVIKYTHCLIPRQSTRRILKSSGTICSIMPGQCTVTYDIYKFYQHNDSYIYVFILKCAFHFKHTRISTVCLQ